MNKDQYWQKIIRERPEFQAGPTASMTLTVLCIRNLVKGAYEAGDAAARARMPDAGKSVFETIFRK